MHVDGSRPLLVAVCCDDRRRPVVDHVWGRRLLRV